LVKKPFEELVRKQVSETWKHDADHRYINHLLAGLDVEFIVLAQATRIAQQSEKANLPLNIGA
jgi:hypothetical protein